MRSFGGMCRRGRMGRTGRSRCGGPVVVVRVVGRRRRASRPGPRRRAACGCRRSTRRGRCATARCGGAPR